MHFSVHIFGSGFVGDESLAINAIAVHKTQTCRYKMNEAHTCQHLSSCRFSPLFHVTFCVRRIESFADKITIQFCERLIDDMKIHRKIVCADVDMKVLFTLAKMPI